MAEHINAEVNANVIKTMEDCSEWVSWSFYDRRLQQNPNFYNLLEVSQSSINEHLSDLIEGTIM